MTERNGNGDAPRASDFTELRRAVESAHRRIDSTDRDMHVLKSQMMDVRTDVKALTAGQQDQSEVLAGMRQSLRFLEEAERERQKREGDRQARGNGESGDRKSSLAMVISVLVAVIFALLQFLERT